MTQPSVLVVDDNASTRQLVRIMLAAEGYAVREAEDGETALAEVARQPPDLILQDLVLPDCNGYDLVARLRALPGASDIPILAFSGFQPAAAKARSVAAGFTDFLFKPVERSVLLQTIGAYLKVSKTLSFELAHQRRVLVADDDPVQLKITSLHLEAAGYHVSTAGGGEEALRLARVNPPDVIVSDVMMPVLDGFRLCLAVRADPLLARVPLVLHSIVFTEDADRLLATSVGATELVVKMPDCGDLLAAVTRSLGTTPQPLSVQPRVVDIDDYTQRIIHQLERVALINARLVSRVGWLETERAILGGLVFVMKGTPSVETLVEELLYRFVDAAGVSRGLAYLVDLEGTLTARSEIGLADLSEEAVRTFFGQSELLWRAMRQGAAVVVPSEEVSPEVAQLLLTNLKAESVIIVPLGVGHEQMGVFAVASEHQSFSDEWRAFAESIGAVIGQTIELARTVVQLRESEERYRRIVETTTEGIWTVDASDRITFVNQRLADLLGHRVDLMIGTSIYEFMTSENAALARASAERRRNRIDEQLEFRYRRKDGSELQTWLATNSLFAADGMYEGALGMVTDVTERKSLEAQLEQAQKMEAIGQLAGGVAHDFNNLLTVINGFSELLVDQANLTEDQRGAITQIALAGASATSLTRQLLAFSRRQVIVPRNLDLNATVDDLGRMLRRLIGEDIAFSTLLAPSLGTIRADPGQIEQILFNLATNSRDAMPRGGRLSIETANVDLDDAYSSQHADAKPGPHVVLAVTDTGIGMDAAVRARIFEPFFTTKEVGKGTGLGLAAIHGIVTQHGGSIDVSSEPGVGTTFKVYFPRIAQPASSRQEVAAPERRPRGTETILVAEDDSRLRALTRAALEGSGYTVLEAGDGEAAVSVAEQHAGPIDLLLTDVVMPKLGGRLLAERLASSFPAMKVIYISGYTDDMVVRHGIVNATVEFLQKPFTIRALQDKVRQVLDGE